MRPIVLPANRLIDELILRGFRVDAYEEEGQVFFVCRGLTVVATVRSRGFQAHTVTFGQADVVLTMIAGQYGRLVDGGHAPPRIPDSAWEIRGSVGQRLFWATVGRDPLALLFFGLVVAGMLGAFRC